jgi:hypothetical protein
VRETFTVTGVSRKAGAVAVQVRRLAGDAPLSLRLEHGDGTLMAQGEAEGPLPACTPSGALGGCAWVGLTFAGPQTLAPGQTYHLLLSAPASASYEVYPMRKGTDKGFSDATLFPDGHAEYRDGGAWAGWDQWGHVRLTNADLQIYFRLRP